ncbi:MAG TPA: hypothetical protein VI796_06735 [Candidatus Thermoplasmatota archaeon]|nr:hypothetical protein [Candidatus Thermoplasmatota archaeon]
MTATIALPEQVRDRLKTFGHAGMTYPEILSSLMDRVQRDEFVAWCRRRYLENKEWVDLDDI